MSNSYSQSVDIEDTPQQFKKKTPIPQYLPAIEIFLSATHYSNAILYRSKMGVINDEPDFAVFRRLQGFSYAFGISMFLCGVLSIILMRYKNKFLSLANIILHISGTITCVISVGYAIYLMTITSTTINNYWIDPIEGSHMKEYVESIVCFFILFNHLFLLYYIDYLFIIMKQV